MEDRVVFQVRDYERNLIVDAAGRALDRGALPKWRRYGRGGAPFVARPGTDVAVIVEDCASASVVAAAGYTGVSLLGTSLLTSHLPAIRACKRALIALDPDATGKALALARRLQLWLPTRVVRLKDDPKYYPPAKLRMMLDCP
jgi:DNA primase